MMFKRAAQRQPERDNTPAPAPKTQRRSAHIKETPATQTLQAPMLFGLAHGIQAKLNIGTPADAAEHEADAIADQIVQAPENIVRRCTCGGIAGPDGECAACRAKRIGIQRRAAPTAGRDPSTAPPSVHATINQTGMPLSSTIHSYLQPHFTFDLSSVRIHTDSAAAESARDVRALAYTVGNHLVFAPGQYRPETREGRRLLAHELVHVGQQGAALPAPLRRCACGSPLHSDGMCTTCRAQQLNQHDAAAVVRRAWESCGTDTDCPPRAPGEQERARTASLQAGTMDAPEPGFIVYQFAIGSSNVSSLPTNPTWSTFVRSLATAGDHWEILGFSDCEGGTERNNALRAARAQQVYGLLPPAARANIDRQAGASLNDCIASNDSEANRAYNRAIVFRRTVSVVTMPDESVRSPRCPPSSTAAVTNLADYVALIRCAESRTGYAPREMLAMLRQLYYGKSWSATSTTSNWDNVIPCSPDLGNPQSRLGTNLYEALRNSAEVATVDVGHVFTGLESMVCPASQVNFFAGLASVTMSNEEFATWGGDLGAAAAASIACPELGSGAATSDDCGHSAGTHPFSFYLAEHAPSQDLEGDIDAFVMRANLLGIPCAGSARRTFTPNRAISAIFGDYYLDPSTSLGTANTNRYRCLLEMMGATISGNRVTNRAAVQAAVAPRVQSFATAFYVHILGVVIGGTSSRNNTVQRVLLLQAETATDWFITYLETRL